MTGIEVAFGFWCFWVIALFQIWAMFWALRKLVAPLIRNILSLWKGL